MGRRAVARPAVPGHAVRLSSCSTAPSPNATGTAGTEPSAVELADEAALWARRPAGWRDW